MARTATPRKGIYTIENTVNGKIYVGSSEDMARRLGEHRSELRGNRHRNAHLQNSWNRDKESAFEFNIICDVDGGDAELVFAEGYWIKFLHTCDRKNGYNRSIPTEDNTRFTKTEETRRKLSEALRGHEMSEQTRRKLSEAMKGRKPWNEGVQHTDESRRKMSEAKKGCKSWTEGKKLSAETCRKISEATKGRKPWNKGVKGTEETCRKISEAAKKRAPFSIETRRKISEASKRRKGYKHTEESRRKMSEAKKGYIPCNKGSKHTEETRRKMREAWKKRRTNRSPRGPNLYVLEPC